MSKRASSIAVALFAAGCGAGAELVEESGDPAGTSELAADAKVWRTRLTLEACSSADLSEDFSSGRYNVHRYAFVLEPGGEAKVELTRDAGAWQPAVLLASEDGELLYDGISVVDSGVVTISTLTSGRSGDTASITLSTERSAMLRLYVTAWSAVDTSFRTMLPRTSEYRLSLVQECQPPMGGGDWRSLYVGLEMEGSQIPRAGLANATLRASLGVRVEPYGTVQSFDGFDLVSGTISEFGGPNDTGVTTTETGAVSGERLRSLNSPLHPSAATLAASPERYYYAAMRWDYNPNSTVWWRNARILVINPDTGAAIVVRPVDWGPNTRTGRLIDLSPQSLVDLGLSTDDRVLVAFAGRNSQLGVVR